MERKEVLESMERIINPSAIMSTYTFRDDGIDGYIVGKDGYAKYIACVQSMPEDIQEGYFLAFSECVDDVDVAEVIQFFMHVRLYRTGMFRWTMRDYASGRCSEAKSARLAKKPYFLDVYKYMKSNGDFDYLDKDSTKWSDKDRADITPPNIELTSIKPSEFDWAYAKNACFHILTIITALSVLSALSSMLNNM